MAVKLTPQQVYRIREIRREEPYVTTEQIANHFGVTPNNVYKILRRDTWKTRG
jgi:Mn-dependent DtxR family transcriptional regulator